MKKQIILLLLILNPICAHGMEEYPFLIFYSLSSYLSTWLSDSQSDNNQKINESELISELRKDIRNFESKLQFSTWKKVHTGITEKIAPGHLIEEYNNFLQRCYYQENCLNFNILDSLKKPSFLKNCQKEQIDGYSALSAFILAPDMDSYSYAQHFMIQSLINLDFKPTTKDIMLANLYLYDGLIIEQKKMFMHLLYALPATSWHVLPQDIRNKIAQLIVQLFKKNQEKDLWISKENALWLLHEKTEDILLDGKQLSTKVESL